MFRSIGYTNGQKDQLLDLAAIEWKIHDLPLVDYLADGRRLSRDYGRIPSDVHLLGNRTDAHCDLLCRRLADGELDAGLRLGGHPFLLDGELVFADRQPAKQVIPRPPVFAALATTFATLTT